MVVLVLLLMMLSHVARAHDVIDDLAAMRPLFGAPPPDSDVVVQPPDPAAGAAEAKEVNGVVEHGSELWELAQTNWPAAEPLLVRYSDPQQPILNAMALSIRYAHQPTDDLRTMLKRIAGHRDQPIEARTLAIAQLAANEWDGRDEWVASLFSDATLHNVLFEIMDLRFIPVVSPLLRSDDRTVRENAVKALLAVAWREDVLRLLLPWIADPQWAADDGNMRSMLMMQAGEEKMLDAVPFLIGAIVRDDLPGNAAMALHAMNVRVDRGVLLAALHRCTDPQERDVLRCAIVFASEPDDLAAAIEGLFLGRKGDVAEIAETALQMPNEDVAAAVIRRAQRVDATTAAKMRNAIVTWPVPTADREKLRRLADGSGTTEMITSLLLRRTDVSRSLRVDLARLDHGIAHGIAALIADDRIEMARIARGNDADATRALAAAARFIGQPLR